MRAPTLLFQSFIIPFDQFLAHANIQYGFLGNGENFIYLDGTDDPIQKN